MIAFMSKKSKPTDDHKTPRLAVQLPEDAARVLRELVAESGRTHVEELRRAIMAWRDSPARLRIGGPPKD